MFGAFSKKDLETINNYFEQFVNFTQFKQNRFNYIEKTGNKNLDLMFSQWNTIIKKSEKLIRDDIKVIGEVVLATDKMEQGIFDVKINATTQNPMVRTLANNMNKMIMSLHENMDQLELTLLAYSKDDYRPDIEISSKLKDKMLTVMNSINTLGATLSQGAKNNLQNGESLEQNSSIMKASMDNLSAKANEQAASLEETAAAVEEITSLTRNNAENAQKMAQLGQTLKGAVTEGQDLATRTAKSMEEINDKVTAISESINVIDQIAFQTNILSLNAAVEAATAGEAGKGFAVVAQEVRNLASRSAEAAKEIKDLVEDANSKANEGKRISDEMRKGYEILNTHISETIHIIGDVSSSSKEQMTGIEQINDAVTMLDQVTQENASESNKVTTLSEEVAYLANSLVNDAASKQFN